MLQIYLQELRNTCEKNTHFQQGYRIHWDDCMIAHCPSANETTMKDMNKTTSYKEQPNTKHEQCT